MTAREMIADVVPTVKTSDSVQKVLDRMAEFRVRHLPIVNDVQFLGLISDEDLIEVPDYSSSIGSLELNLSVTCLSFLKFINLCTCFARLFTPVVRSGIS